MHVITGAGSGIGRGITIALARRGEAVVAVARGDQALAELADEAGPNVITVAADVTTADGRNAVAAATGAEDVHSIVHGAGSVVELSAWHDLDAARLVEHFRVHVAAPIATTQALLHRGRVERVAILDSYAATTPRIGWSAYAMLKADGDLSAVEHLYIDRIDLCLYANTLPFRIRIVIYEESPDKQEDV